MLAVRSSTHPPQGVHRRISEEVNPSGFGSAPAAHWDDALLELVCAAVVSSSFCKLLLTNPAQALDQGFNGQRFTLSPDDYSLVSLVQATSLEEFVTTLSELKMGATTS